MIECHQILLRLPNIVLQNQLLQIEITVKITAIWKLSSTVGYISKNGKMNNCINVDRINPLPTSIHVSNKFLKTTSHILI